MMNQKLHVGAPVLHGSYPNHYYTNPLVPTTLDSLLIPQAADVGLACNGNGKRGREYCDYSAMEDSGAVPQKSRMMSSLMDREAIVIQLQNQQREIDSLIALQTQRLRMGLEERERRRYKALVSAVREGVTASLRDKDEEILRLSKFNWGLQERVRGLSVENELWRGLAQSNEATVNSLRTDLKHVLTSATLLDDRNAPVDEDAESCCGSSNRASGDHNDAPTAVTRGCKGGCGGRNEAGVMVMPCRHLCLCTACGSGSRQSCPICGSVITASIHVNFSTSS